MTEPALPAGATTTIRTDRPGRWAKQFISHWGRHGGQIDADGTVTTIRFDATEHWPASAVRVDTHSDALIITAWSPDQDSLRANCDSIAEHLRRFAGARETLIIEWNYLDAQS